MIIKSLYHGTRENPIKFPLHPMGTIVPMNKQLEINRSRAAHKRFLVRPDLRVGELGRKFSTDFGQGVYLTDNREFAHLHACAKGAPGYVYQFDLDLDGLNVYRFAHTNLQWLLYVAFNRGSFARTMAPELHDDINKFKADYDVIIGPTANDRYYNFLQYFLSYRTDFILRMGHQTILGILSKTQLPTQYTLLTPKACSQARKIFEKKITDAEFEEYNQKADKRQQMNIEESNRVFDAMQQTNVGYNLEGLVAYLETQKIRFSAIPEQIDYDPQVDRQMHSSKEAMFDERQ